MISKIKYFFTERLTRRTRLFLKSSSISFASAVLLMLVVVIAWNWLTSPPDQREVIAAPPVDQNNPIVDDEGFLIVDNTEPSDDDEYDEPSLPTYNAPSWAVDRREYFWTFLIIGLNEGTNANTVMAASYCGITRESSLISIPRDIPVHPTRNGRKLSSSYMIGAGGGRGIAGGVAQMQRDVQTVIGFIPDFYVVIDYDAFFSIIDAVGGISVYVPVRMRYDDPLQNLRIDIQPGYQHMDSATALDFARFRQGNPGFPDLPGGDIGRVANQQAVINAVISRLLRPENIFRINEFVSIFNESVYTNISLLDMLFFANELNRIRRTDSETDALTTYTFAAHAATSNNISYMFLTPSNVVELVNSTINPFDRPISAADLRIIRP